MSLLKIATQKPCSLKIKGAVFLRTGLEQHFRTKMRTIHTISIFKCLSALPFQK